jgi:peptidoglycan/LPS O-acetylase OafA/YrhL
VTIPRRLPELDGIRGAAILAVIFHHVAQSFAPQAGLLGRWLSLTRAGWLGVDVFFALSGFLITRGLLETTDRPRYYRNFYSRRILRLAPLYLLVLGLVFVTIPHSGSFLALSLVYLANFAKPLGIGMAYGPLWSLSVEEHFYLAWPAVAKNTSRQKLLAVCIAICALTPVARYVAATHGFFDPYASWFRLDGLAWGALMAVMVQMVSRETFLRTSQTLIVVGAILFGACAATGGVGRGTLLGSTFVYGIVAMMTAGVLGDVALHSGALRLAFLRASWLTLMGEISYWVYLTHLLVIVMVVRSVWFVRVSGWGGYALLVTAVLGFSVVTGVAVRRYIEAPISKLKALFREPIYK